MLRGLAELAELEPVLRDGGPRAGFAVDGEVDVLEDLYPPDGDVFHTPRSSAS